MQHDFRETFWGHNFGITCSGDEGRGWTISTPLVKVGDTLLWRTSYGECVAEVTESNPFGDPHDMSAVRAKIVERRVSEEALAQIDEHGEPPWEYTLLKETN
jgi:hypothetical protein